MFGIFRKKTSHSLIQFTDLNFLSEEAKDRAVLGSARESNAVFVAWFPATMNRYRKLFAGSGIDENRVIDARSFSAAKFPGKEIIFLEHYPLRAKEEQLLQNTAQQEFKVYNSLTEPFFHFFGGDKMIEMMKKMGSDENETFQHAFISSAIRNAQHKLAKKIRSEQSASSQREWMDRNAGPAGH